MSIHAIAIVLEQSLVSLQRNEIPYVNGKDLVRLSCANLQRQGRHLGLLGDIAPLLLRWGGSQRELHRSLVCCPERREMLQTLSPDWLAKNVGDYLVDLLEVGRHLHNVSPDWLAKNIRSCNDLMYCLGAGGHLGALSAEWVAQNFKQDMNKTAALIECGLLDQVTPDWIFDNIKSYAHAFWALATKMDITGISPAWFKLKAPFFEDFAAVVDVVGRMGMDTPMILWFINVYETQYRDPECAPSDLTLALIKINDNANSVSNGCSFDIALLLATLRGVPYKELYCLFDVIQEITGVTALCDSLRRPHMSRQDALELCFECLGWPAHSEFDRQSIRVVCQLVLSKCT
jgi:hypothetical protein